MKIHVNHAEVELGTRATVADLVAARQLPDRGIAVAVENKVVPKAQWHTTLLFEGAQVTIIRAVCGG